HLQTSGQGLTRTQQKHIHNHQKLLESFLSGGSMWCTAERWERTSRRLRLRPQMRNLPSDTRKAFYDPHNSSHKNRAKTTGQLQETQNTVLPPTPIPSLIQKRGSGFKVAWRSRIR